jgi:hypothetical protein
MKYWGNPLQSKWKSKICWWNPKAHPSQHRWKPNESQRNHNGCHLQNRCNNYTEFSEILGVKIRWKLTQHYEILMGPLFHLCSKGTPQDVIQSYLIFAPILQVAPIMISSSFVGCSLCCRGMQRVSLRISWTCFEVSFSLRGAPLAISSNVVQLVFCLQMVPLNIS